MEPGSVPDGLMTNVFALIAGLSLALNVGLGSVVVDKYHEVDALQKNVITACGGLKL